MAPRGPSAGAAARPEATPVTRRPRAHGADIFCADTSGAAIWTYVRRPTRQWPRELLCGGSTCSDRALRPVPLLGAHRRPNAVAGDENLTRQIGAFVVGDVAPARANRRVSH